MSGGKGKQTVGYRYYMGLLAGLCHGPVDAILEIRGGDVTLWTGEQTASGTITINKPNAYGGDEKEGGVVGTFDVQMGEPTQGANSYLTSVIGGLQNAYRGLLTFVSRGAQIGSNNPYPKPFSFRVYRAKKGWKGGAAWYPDKAEIIVGAPVVLPPNATGWEYQIIDEHPDPGYTNLTPPTSGWSVGQAPFAGGTIGGGNTTWPIRTILWARKTITVPGGRPYTLYVQAENGCTVLVDGVVVGGYNRENANIPGGHTQTFSYQIPAGTRTIAIKAFDEYTAFGGGTFLSAETLVEGSKAMNPAHIVYQCLTDDDWGMGYPTTIIDDAAFKAAADQLYAEGFGLCLLWKRDDSIENFLQHIMDTVGAVLVQSRTTGLFQLNLIRGGYNIASLPVFTADDVQVVSVDGAVLTGATNEITVNWFDPLRKEKRATTLQSLGNIQSQGVIVSATKDYPGIPTADIAARVAARDLRAMTVPLKRVELRMSRKAYDLLPGGLFVLNFPDYGIESMVFRVGEVDYGTLEQGYITVTAVQDVFSLPDTTYIVPPDTGWTPPNTEPLAAPYSAPFEVDYRSLYRQLSQSDLDALPADAGYAGMLNARPSGTAINYQVWSRVSPANYAQHGEGDFCPTATLDGAIDRLTTSISLLAGIDLDNVEVPCAALIDGEIVAVTALDPVAGTATIGRGCVDTVPTEHADGARIWFFDDHIGSDAVQYTTGEAVDQKALTNTSQATLAIENATPVNVTIQNRHSRPYPPGNVKINGTAYPTTVSGDFIVTWAHRNRVTQADQLVATTAASVTPADNTRYGLRFLDESDAVIVERTDIGPGTATVSLNYTGNVTMELYTIDAVGESLQRHRLTFAFTGAGTNTINATAYTPVNDSTVIDGGDLDG